MNQHDDTRTTALLEAATADLTTDVDRLVRAGVSRGRALRRRRRTTTALASVAVLGVLGAGVGVVTSGGGEADRAVEPAAPSSPDPTADTPDAPRRIGFDPTKGASLLRSLLPEGEVSHLQSYGSDDPRDPSRVAQLRFRGGQVQLSLEKPDAAGGPMAQCQAQPTSTCRTLEDGSVLGQVELRPPDLPGVVTLFSTLYAEDGFVVFASASNAAGDPPVVVGDEPVLGFGELESLVTDPVWFDEQQ